MSPDSGAINLNSLPGILEKTDPEENRPGKLTAVLPELNPLTLDMDQGTGQLSRRLQETSSLSS